MHRAMITGPDVGPMRHADTGRQMGHGPKTFSALRRGKTRQAKKARVRGISRRRM